MAKMVCSQYYPAYTHNDWASCDNCKYKGFFGCRNAVVKSMWKDYEPQKGEVKNEI